VVEAQLPALVTVTEEINEPRIPSLSQILKAGRKPLQEWKSSDLDISADELGGAEIDVVSNLAPMEERKGIIWEGKLDESIDNLINSLIKEGVLGR
jgi:electron transfer flavoprotein beta subunit